MEDPADHDITHFSLRGLLPTGHCLAFNPELGTLCHLSIGEKHGAHLWAEAQFTSQECLVLQALLVSHPHHCPYEVLLANFHHGHMHDTTVQRWRQRAEDAREAGAFDQLMRPVRNMLSRTRLKLHAIGLDVVSIFETGYILIGKARPGESRTLAFQGFSSLQEEPGPSV